MQNDDNTTNYQHAARLTVHLVDHSHAPDRITDAILETLIDMAGESEVNIWLLEAGLSLYGLSQLYSLYEIGAGNRRARLYGNYEMGRLKDDG